MSLTGKEKRELRAKANRLKPSINIGKNGISDNVLKELTLQLKTSELVKIKLTKSLSEKRKEIASELAVRTSSNLVQLFGFTVILFKKGFKE